MLLIYCYYNKDSRNSLSAGVRLLASFSFETILSLAWPDTVLSCVSWDVSGCTFLSPLPSCLSPPCPLNVRGTWGLLSGPLFSLHFSLDVLIHSRASKRYISCATKKMNWCLNWCHLQREWTWRVSYWVKEVRRGEASYDIPSMRNLKRNDISELTYKTETHRLRKWTYGCWEEGIVREFGKVL